MVLFSIKRIITPIHPKRVAPNKKPALSPEREKPFNEKDSLSKL
jgi:hypothetical protein